MKSGFSENVSNGLRVCLDWLAFTIQDASEALEAVEFLGFESAEFVDMPRGMHGYLSRIRHHSLAVDILSKGREDMGVHIVIAGSALHDVIVSYYKSHLCNTPFDSMAFEVSDFETTVLREFLIDITRNCQITRIDLAIDDIGGLHYSVSDVRDILVSGSYSSKFRGWREINGFVNGKSSGSTIYMGSPQSAIMLRIYDKQAEQNIKAEKDNLPLIDVPWVRWEMEFKKERAHKAGLAIASGIPVREVAIGVLANYLRFVVNDDVRIDRCSTDLKWATFCNGVRKMSLYVPTPPRTIDDTKRWLLRQVSPSLANVIKSEYGDSAFIYQMLEYGAIKLGFKTAN